jgi:antirestriction protein ArdC
MKQDVYERITGQIVTALEQGVRPWLKPWNAEHAAGRITKPLRAAGIPYQGINVIMLWSEAAAKGYAAPIWMTVKQAIELGGHFYTKAEPQLDPVQRTDRAEAFFAATGADIRHGGN